MARKKTKKEKQSTQKKRTTGQLHPTPTYTYTDESPKQKKETRAKTPTKPTNIYNYDPSLIVADLRKTISLSILVFAILIGLYLAGQSGYISLFS